MPAPIAYFAFNRPEHTSRTLTALAQNPEASSTVLEVFVDGARNDAGKAAVDAVRKIAAETEGFMDVRVHCTPRNFGLYKSITDGVTRILAESDRVIVVEDDILVSPVFLRYMNDALDRYADEPAVGSIHAYSPPVEGLPDFFFLRGGDCWGWATWSDRWRLFDADARRLLHRMVTGGEVRSFARTNGVQGLRHLVRRARNKNQSWAAHWNASLFLEEKLTLHPGRSLVQNIGNDGSGTHSNSSARYDTLLANSYSPPPDLPLRHDFVAGAKIRGFNDSSAGAPIFGEAFRDLNLLVVEWYARTVARSKGLNAEVTGKSR